MSQVSVSVIAAVVLSYSTRSCENTSTVNLFLFDEDPNVVSVVILHLQREAVPRIVANELDDEPATGTPVTQRMNEPAKLVLTPAAWLKRKH